MLEVKLFDRLPRGVRPTWYGETMIRHARMALASLSQAHEEIDALKAGRFGSVSIGTITAPAITLLPEAVAQVKAAHPSLRVGLQIETSDVLIDRLAQGKLDMVVGRLFARHDKSDLRYEALVEEPIAAVVRPGHPLMEHTSLKLADLSAARLDRAARRQRAAPPLRADVPGGRPARAQRPDRDDRPAVHDQDARAERPDRRRGLRRRAVLPGARPRRDPAGGAALQDGRLRPDHAHRPPAGARGAGDAAGDQGGGARGVRHGAGGVRCVYRYFSNISVRRYDAPRQVERRENSWRQRSPSAAARPGSARTIATGSSTGAGSRTRAIRTTNSMAGRSSASATRGAS